MAFLKQYDNIYENYLITSKIKRIRLLRYITFIYKKLNSLYNRI